MNAPYHATMVGSTLFVADSSNHRVLVFNNAVSKVNGGAADFVLGQPNFVSNGSATTQASLSTPQGIAVDKANSKVLIGEISNHRVVVYSANGS